jgi:hypothetical protein
MKKETYDQLVKCETMDEVETILDTQQEGFGKDYRFVDEKIDDGSDDEEDPYVMMRSYDFYVEGEEDERHTRFYYGNNTRKIGCVD